MRIVDELPRHRRKNKYPWDDIAEAVEKGQIVALDADDYGVSPEGLRSAVYYHVKTEGLNWEKSLDTDEGVLYIWIEE